MTFYLGPPCSLFLFIWELHVPNFQTKELHVPLLLGPIKTWERNVPNWDAIRNKQFLVELSKLSRWEQVFPITLKENLTGNRN